MFEYNSKSLGRSEAIEELLVLAIESGYKIGMIPGSPDGSTAAIDLNTFEDIKDVLTSTNNCEFTITRIV